MFLNFFSKLAYNLYTPYLIEPDLEDKERFDLLGNRKKTMWSISKYFIWRRYSLFLAIPILITDLVFNVLDYQEIKENVHNPVNSSFLYSENELDGISNTTNEFIDFLYTRKTDDFLYFYMIYSSIFITMELLFVMIAIYYSHKWIYSRKWIKKSAYVSIFWIYSLYLNPFLNFLNYREEEKNTVYLYILVNLMKEMLPIIVCCFTGLIWASMNLKVLFPENLYIGWLFKWGNNLFLFSMGGMVLLVNQLFSNYLISLGIVSLFLGIYLPNCFYGNEFKNFCRSDDDESLYIMVFRTRIINNLFFGFGLLLIGIYFMIHGLDSLFYVDFIQMIVKFAYRSIFFKVFISDMALYWILYMEKSKNLYVRDLEKYTEKMRDIDDLLLMDSYYKSY